MKSKIQRSNLVYQQKVEQLLDELAGTDDAVLNMAAIDGGWSTAQIIHHLILVEELSLAYVKKKLSFKPDLKPAGLDVVWRSVVLNVSLNVPIKMKAPANISDENLPGFTTFADNRRRWLAIREEWTLFLSELPDELLDKAVYKHPLVGRLSWSGMLSFFGQHLRRHHRQIRRTLGK